VLGAARRLGREGQALLLGQRVDGGGLAGVGAADEGDLGQLGRGQVDELAGGQEARGVRPGQRELSVIGSAATASGIVSVMEARAL
jgi:hypothetical protein